MNPKTARPIWQADGTPRSPQFDDPYFSAGGGLAEARHVFLAGNALPARFIAGFHIAELGFGTGLNLLAAWQAWQQSAQAGPLRFTSFEAYPLTRPDMEKALGHWPSLASLAQPLLSAWPCTDLRLPSLHFKLVLGDARTTLPTWKAQADAWFLDGFSPGKNPEMWKDTLMKDVGQHTAPQGTFATYTAAGHVRRKLAAAGFTVSRVAGYGRKRHMSLGTLPT